VRDSALHDVAPHARQLRDLVLARLVAHAPCRRGLDPTPAARSRGIPYSEPRHPEPCRLIGTAGSPCVSVGAPMHPSPPFLPRTRCHLETWRSAGQYQLIPMGKTEARGRGGSPILSESPRESDDLLVHQAGLRERQIVPRVFDDLRLDPWRDAPEARDGIG